MKVLPIPRQTLRAEIKANSHQVRQGIRLLERLTNDQYTLPVAELGGQRIGPQFRHILDHYESFLNGLWRFEIDYEKRARAPQLESNRANAIAKCRELEIQLDRLDWLEPTQPLVVNREEAASDSWADSSAARELQYLLSHTIHHYALIAMLSRRLGVEPDEEFGLAPSTQRYRQRLSLCAR
jgi:uncharacterized damage-inducible protein DinB